ncbi:MAG: hypothetical protein Q8L66_16505 [Caulobacter sp.]|nr:hypothetical protein [Caulobacter sp.]
MARIDIGRTAFAGFSLIGRKPMALIGWALFIFVLGVLPAIGMAAALGSSMADLMALGDTDPTPEQMMPFMSTIYAGQAILWLPGLLMRIMLAGAIFRAVLEPSQGRWAYLRLGMGEVMLALVTICLGILLGMGALIWALISFGVGAAVWQASHQAAIGVGVLFGLVLVVAFVWALLRFSLAAPMSLAERSFRLFESWSLTRGHVLSLLLVGVLLVITLLVLEAAVMAVLFGVIAGVAGVAIGAGGLAGFNEESIRAFFGQPPETWMATLGPWVLAAGLVISLVGAAAFVITTAPWAEAYRQLRAPTAAPSPEAAADALAA